MLSDFGEESEARQYSGREVAENWETPIPVAAECPFEH
jgi:FPC/CPF motif-containing protein YcgG